MRLGPALAAWLFAIPSILFALEPPGHWLDLDRSLDGLPVLAVELGGETLRLAVDTGTSRSMIAAAVATRLALVPRARYQVVAAGGEARTALCAGPLSVDIDGFTLSIDCLGWVPEETTLAGAPDVDGLLGADALAGIGLLLDLERGRARIAPSGALAAWFDGQRLDLELVERRPAIRVAIRALGRRAPTARLVLDSGANAALLFGELARAAQRALGGRTFAGRLENATGASAIRALALGELRSDGARFDGGWAVALPAVADRLEDGLLPLAALGPAVLLDLSGGLVVLAPRRRAAPRREPLADRGNAQVAALASGPR